MTVSSDPDAVTGDGFDESLIADINVTPLVDVMLVLLVVFMIAAPLMTHGVAIDLPKKGGGALGQPAKPLFVSLTHDGSVFLRDQRIAEGALVSRLRDIRAAEGDIPAYVRADRGIPYGMVMDVVSRVGEGGFSHISLLTQPSRPQSL